MAEPVPDGWLDGDAARLNQVFSNLLNNASKYSPHGFEIRLWCDDNRQVRIVAITGWGQDEDRRQAAQAGFDCHLLKPADPQVVERILSAVSRDQRCAACGDNSLGNPLA